MDTREEERDNDGNALVTLSEEVFEIL